MNNIKENAKNVVNEIKSLNPNVTLIAASKTHTAEEIMEANSGGIEIFAENRVQEFREKFPNTDVRWHFIGRLQTNKVKYIVGKVELIHSVDSIRLADAIEKRAEKENVVQDILLEVNVGKEDSKGGVDVDYLNELYLYTKSLKHLRVCGLMSVLPINAEKDLYLQIKEIYDKMKLTDSNFKYLSVGMSSDYKIAIECGSNVVRIGTKIFGKRSYDL